MARQKSVTSDSVESAVLVDESEIAEAVESKKQEDINEVKEVTLTKVEICYIQNNPSLSSEQIAEDLGIPADIVKQYRPVQASQFMKSMITSGAGGRKGAVAMTLSASMLSDENRKKNKGKFSPDYVYNPMIQEQ